MINREFVEDQVYLPAEKNMKIINESHPLLSIIIRGSNNKDLIIDLLSSLKANISKYTFEIIYVDNASSDNTIPVVELLFPDVIIIKNDSNVGPCKATNMGLHKAKGDIFLILDSDVKILSSIDPIIGYMLKTSDCAAATGNVLNFDGSYQSNITSMPNLRTAIFVSLMHLGFGALVEKSKTIRTYYQKEIDREKPCTIQKAGSCCFFIKSAAYKTIGDMDERFFMYFEDVDWCIRINKNKLSLHYFPDLRVLHYGGQTTSSELRTWKLNKIYQQSLVVFCKKHIFPKHCFFINFILMTLIQARYFILRFHKWLFGTSYIGGAGYKKLQNKVKKAYDL